LCGERDENNYFTEMCSGSEEGSYLRLTDLSNSRDLLECGLGGDVVLLLHHRLDQVHLVQFQSVHLIRGLRLNLLGGGGG